MSYAHTHSSSVPILPPSSQTHVRSPSGTNAAYSQCFSPSYTLQQQTQAPLPASTLAAAQRRRQMVPASLRAAPTQPRPYSQPGSARSFSDPAISLSEQLPALVPNRYHRASRTTPAQIPPSAALLSPSLRSVDAESNSTATTQSSASSYTSAERSPLIKSHGVMDHALQAHTAVTRGHKHQLSLASAHIEHRAKRVSVTARPLSAGCASRASFISNSTGASAGAPVPAPVTSQLAVSDPVPAAAPDAVQASPALVLPSDVRRIRRASMPHLSTVIPALESEPTSTSKALPLSSISPVVAVGQNASNFTAPAALKQRPKSALPAPCAISANTDFTVAKPSFSLTPISALGGQVSTGSQGTSTVSARSILQDTRPADEDRTSGDGKANIQMSSAKTGPVITKPTMAINNPRTRKATTSPMANGVASQPRQTSPPHTGAANHYAVARAPASPKPGHATVPVSESTPVYENLKADEPAVKLTFKAKLKRMMSRKNGSGKSRDQDAVSVRSGTSAISGLSAMSGRSVSSVFSFRTFPRLFTKQSQEDEQLPPVMHNFDIEQPPLIPVITQSISSHSSLPSPPLSTHAQSAVESPVPSSASNPITITGDNDLSMLPAPVSTEPIRQPCDHKLASASNTSSDNEGEEAGVDLSTGGTVFPGSLDEKDVATIRRALERVGSLDRRPSRRSSRNSRSTVTAASVNKEQCEDFETTLEQLDSFVNLSLTTASSLTELGSPRAVRFANQIRVYETHACSTYDRRPEPATCNRLTPALAQQIKRELNSVKLTMEVHRDSRDNTQFF